ncbi:GEVED domain-containing protein [Deinococcus sp. Marseille-Q6407]|uniref:DUF7933 domain-containing protein n=1 Tax=Deinococcus sp. Marseille-Q6407 TaxID=2969223 RepID=UPI0021BED26D|nr:GEVED domain-containing protein [Deinococcus sp. Marseille-Q6407]
MVPQVDKSFDQSTVQIDPATGTAKARLTITVSNPNRAPVMIYRDIVDSLPAGSGGGQMVVSNTPNYQAVCVNSSGVTITNNSGYNSLSYESSDGSGATVPPAPTAGVTRWAIPGNTIVPAGTCRFSFDVTLPRAGTYNNSIPANIRTSGGNDADGAQATITALAAPTIAKAYSPKSIPGDGKATSTLTITLNNPAPAATTLTAPLTDNIGSGLEITGVTTTCPVKATVSGSTITYPSGATLNPGSCTITAAVRSTRAGSYPNTIAAGALQTSAGSNAAAASDTLTVTPVADLAVTKTDNVDSVTLGGSTTYTLRVTNNGPSSVSGATLTDTLGTGLTLGSLTCTAAAGNTCTTAPTSTSTTLPALAAGAFYEVQVRANVTGRDSNGNVVNTASVAVPTGTTDPNTANNSASDTDTVISAAPQLSVTKVADQSSYLSGGNVTYTVTVTNSTPNTFTTAPLQLRDLLPQGLQLVSVSRSGGAAGTVSNASPAGTTGEVTWNFTPGLGLNTGESVSFAVTATIPDTYLGGQLTNRVSVGGGSNNGAAAPDPASCTATTGQCAAATISVQAAPPPAVQPNELSNYTTCLDFSNVNLSGSGTRSWTLDAGSGITLNYAVTLSGQSRSGDSLQTYPSSDGYQNSGWYGYFGNPANSSLKLQGNGGTSSQTMDFQFSAWATLTDGTPVPLTLLTGSTGDDGTSESVSTTTNGTAFAAAYVSSAGKSNRNLTVSNGGRTAQVQTNRNNTLILATSKTASQNDPLILNNTLRRASGNGATAQGFCAAFFHDYGDAPSSYGSAQHLLEPGFSSSLAPGATSLDSVTAATLNATSPVRLGVSVSTEPQPRGTSGNDDTYDETARNFPALQRYGSSYSVTLPYVNDTAQSAPVTAWIDFNGNGTFDAAEAATAQAASGAGSVTLNWTGVSLPANLSRTYARLRISTSAAGPSGTQANGEVEDHLLTVQETAQLRITKQVSDTYVTVTADPENSAQFTLNPRQLIYTLQVQNTGTATAENVVVSDRLPDGLQYSAAGSTPQAEVSGQQLTYRLPSLAAGGKADIRVVSNVQVTPNRVQGPYENTAAVQATGVAQQSSEKRRTDLVYTRLYKTVRNLTRGGAASTAEKAQPGEALEYCIAAYNYGSTSLSNYAISDYVPGNTLPNGKAFLRWADGSAVTTTPAPSTVYDASFTSWDPDGAGPRPAVPVSGRWTTNNFVLPAGATANFCFQVTVK